MGGCHLDKDPFLLTLINPYLMLYLFTWDILSLQTQPQPLVSEMVDFMASIYKLKTTREAFTIGH
jgi:hypothetical protein